MARAAFVLSVSFDIVTPESAEHGDFAESGWNSEREAMTLRDAIGAIRSRGVEDVDVTGDGIRVRHWPDTNYRDGSETTETSHVEGSERDIARLLRFVERQ